eukprot:TRINITY_DN779_c0_g1_i1.p1 TRINITY_DN779_c0_g1~~TRINITY_DN779_c0_g1_i1.p1  ORF type:complete len:300 (-),score=4.61 TRINITY_DN779_c0_g1_i1:148-1005(-)
MIVTSLALYYGLIFGRYYLLIPNNNSCYIYVYNVYPILHACTNIIIYISTIIIMDCSGAASMDISSSLSTDISEVIQRITALTLNPIQSYNSRHFYYEVATAISKDSCSFVVQDSETAKWYESCYYHDSSSLKIYDSLENVLESNPISEVLLESKIWCIYSVVRGGYLYFCDEVRHGISIINCKNGTLAGTLELPNVLFEPENSILAWAYYSSVLLVEDKLNNKVYAVYRIVGKPKHELYISELADSGLSNTFSKHVWNQGESMDEGWHDYKVTSRVQLCVFYLV